MAKVVRTVFDSYQPQASIDYLNALNNPSIVAYMNNNVPTININDVLLITGYLGNGGRIYRNGVQIAGVDRGFINPQTTIVYSDDFVSIWFYTTWGSGWSTAFGAIYRKVGDLELSGGTAATGSYYPIENFTLLDNNTEQLYKYGKRLDYSADANMINYTQNVLFEPNGIISADIIDTGILACSAIPYGQIITFNGKDYFSIGTNNIIHIES